MPCGRRPHSPARLGGVAMWDYTAFLQAVIEVLRSHDERTCLALLDSVGRRAGAPVSLPEGDVTVADCVSYAEVLIDLGEEQLAVDVLRGALLAA